MKLIIDIPEEIVIAIQNGQDYRYDIHTTIAQGIPYDTSGDLISREALKERFADMREGYPIFRDDEMVSAKVIAEIIDNAPTVMVDNCGKCPYYKDRDRDIITEAYNDGYKTAKEDFGNHKLVNNSQELVKDLVKEKSERPQGEWIKREDMDYIDENKVTNNHFMCKDCGFIHNFIDGHTSQYNFCPNCGADMRGKEE